MRPDSSAKKVSAHVAGSGLLHSALLVGSKTRQRRTAPVSIGSGGGGMRGVPDWQVLVAGGCAGVGKDLLVDALDEGRHVVAHAPTTAITSMSVRLRRSRRSSRFSSFFALRAAVSFRGLRGLCVL